VDEPSESGQFHEAGNILPSERATGKKPISDIGMTVQDATVFEARNTEVHRGLDERKNRLLDTVPLGYSIGPGEPKHPSFVHNEGEVTEPTWDCTNCPSRCAEMVLSDLAYFRLANHDDSVPPPPHITAHMRP
jgi:ribosomal protein L27